MRKSVLCLAAGVALASCSALAEDVGASPVSEVDAALSILVHELAAHTPAVLPDGSRIESVEADNSQLRFNYTLPSVKAANIDGQIFADMMVPSLQEAMCGSRQLDPLVMQGIPMKSVFLDKDAKLIASIVTIPADCGGSAPATSKAKYDPAKTALEAAAVSYQTRLPLQLSDILRADTVELVNDELVYGFTVLGEDGLDLADNAKNGVFIKLMIETEMCQALQTYSALRKADINVRHILKDEKGVEVANVIMSATNCI